MPMANAIRHLDYLGENPPADVILKAVHIDAGKVSGSPRKQAQVEASEMDFAAMQQQMGAPEKMPEHLREMGIWAEAEIKKMNTPKGKQ